MHFFLLTRLTVQPSLHWCRLQADRYNRLPPQSTFLLQCDNYRCCQMGSLSQVPGGTSWFWGILSIQPCPRCPSKLHLQWLKNIRFSEIVKKNFTKNENLVYQRSDHRTEIEKLTFRALALCQSKSRNCG